jgi:O-methyltransferase involved in polyketide biosynthesis
VVVYLTVEQAGSLAEDLRALHPAHYWIVDYFAPQIFKYRRRMTKGKMKNAPFQFNPPDWFQFFESHGWHCKELRYLAEEGERLHRPVQLSRFLKTLVAIRKLVLSPEKVNAFRRFTGYALLEKKSSN